jgi:tetratricopeptide (TPR) repeat protein
VSDALYERYKDALRRGHVAALRGRQDAALAAYGEAAKLAPDRALPLVGIGNVLAGLGKHPEALAAYDAALERAPTDEAALRGRSDVLVASGDRAGAADTLDRLASALDASGRPSDALDAARRALELAESRGRREGVTSMVARLTRSAPPGDARVSETLSRALGILEERVLGRGRGEAGATEDTIEASTAERLAEARAVAAGPEPAQPEPEPVPALPPFDPVAATAAVEDAAASGDAAATRELAEIATAGHLAAGQLYAAIDVCYLALATNPADPGLHLSLAGLYLDLGWRSTAADKLALLAQLAELDGDTDTRARLCAVVAERLPDDPRLVALCA